MCAPGLYHNSQREPPPVAQSAGQLPALKRDLLIRARKQDVVEQNPLRVRQRICSGMERHHFTLDPSGAGVLPTEVAPLEPTFQNRITLQAISESIATAQHRHATGTSYYYHHSKLNAIYSADLHGSGVQVPRDKRADG